MKITGNPDKKSWRPVLCIERKHSFYFVFSLIRQISGLMLSIPGKMTFIFAHVKDQGKNNGLTFLLDLGKIHVERGFQKIF